MKNSPFFITNLCDIYNFLKKDGYYYIKTVNLIDYLVKHPELLDRPANEEVNI